jgi:phytol kinase
MIVLADFTSSYVIAVRDVILISASVSSNNSILIMSASFIVLYLGILVAVAEGLNRWTTVNPEWTRKIVHIGSGHVVLLAWWFSLPTWMGIVAAIAASIVTLCSYYFPILPGVNSVGRKSFGTFFYAVSLGILFACFWRIQQPQYVAIGMLVMAWGDGLAAIVGQKWGKHQYQVWDMTKSWEGSLTMTIVSFLVTVLIFLAVLGNIWQIWLISAAVSIVATFLEAFSKLGIDNLTVPLGSAALAFYASQLLTVS